VSESYTNTKKIFYKNTFCNMIQKLILNREMKLKKSTHARETPWNMPSTFVNINSLCGVY
jgi:hypothetical protein